MRTNTTTTQISSGDSANGNTPITLQIGDRVIATVTSWFRDRGTRGYGFAAVEDVKAGDLFVPGQALLDSTALEIGARVSGEVRMDRAGRQYLDFVEHVE